MKSSRLEKENIIKDVRNLFRLEKINKKTIDTTIKVLKNIFRLKKENKEIIDSVVIGIRNPFEHGDIRNIFRFKKIIK